MTDIGKLVEQRDAVHGPFSGTARTAQCLKEEMKQGRNWRKLNDSQKESLHMIASKMARILSGDHTVADHWIDICGYSKLVADELAATQSKAACVAQIEMSKTTEPAWVPKVGVQGWK